MSDPTLLVIDIGNTNVSLGLFDYTADAAAPVELSQHWRIGTHHEQTSDEVSLTVRALFDHAGRAANEVTDVIISSAFWTPVTRGSRWVPPAPGSRPSFTSGRP